MNALFVKKLFWFASWKRSFNGRILIQSVTGIWKTLGAFEIFASKTIEFQKILIMSSSMTFFMAIERSEQLLLMRISRSSLMSFIKAIPTKQFLLIHTIPICLINLALWAFLILWIPSSHFRCSLICIQIPIFNIILPHILTCRSEVILMIVHRDLLFFCWQINWIVFLCKID